MTDRRAGGTYPWRLLTTGWGDGFWNMGLDEALLEQVAAGTSLPTLRFYGWDPPAVSVGYFQGLEEEVDLAACASRGVDVVRRISGGGAVFHHRELTYSLIAPANHPLITAAGGSIGASYRPLCAGIVAGLARLGVDAVFAPINDILAGGRKVSGNAQTRRRGCVLQHGTVLLDLEVDLMFTLLKVPEEKLKGKLIQDITARVTSLSALLSRPVSFDEAQDALAAGFRESLGLEYVPGGVLPEEAERARILAREKFASPEWLRRR